MPAVRRTSACTVSGHRKCEGLILTLGAPGGAFSMIRISLSSRYFVLAAVSLLVACGGPVDPGQGHGTLIVRADVSGSSVATLVAEVTAPDIPAALIFNIPIAGGVA